MSSELGMCDRLNSQWRLRRHLGVTGKELNTVWLI